VWYDEEVTDERKIQFASVMAPVILALGLLYMSAHAQEASSTLEGTNVLPGGEEIATTTTRAAPIEPDNLTPAQRLEQYLNSLPRASLQIYYLNKVEQVERDKRDTDTLASKYAKLYDSCRFGR